MLDFRKNPSRRNYLSRRYEWRLLLLVMLLGMTILMASEARNPGLYRWLWQGGSDQPAERLATGQPGAAAGAGSVAEGVDGSALARIRDNAPFRPAEQEAWSQLLRILARTGPDRLQQSSLGRVTYVELFHQPDRYRGKLVTLRGRLRRVDPLPAAEGDADFFACYRAVLQPEDNQQNPVILFLLELPEGMAAGMKMDEPVGVTGFFFKRWEYEGQRDLLIAPVVLAKTLHWFRRPSGNGADGWQASPLAVMAVALAIAAVVSGYVYWRTGSSSRRGGLGGPRTRSPGQSPVDPESFLRELAEQHGPEKQG
ncbi:MAG TPA: hypothetical protein EYP56_07730 [Planctomycetaceae bacterium]|nr:hypothetical protein [Planctomycetaceae bacterium]HIQ20786.1 hypothetical protein [Planctomycetota bacterium]